MKPRKPNRSTLGRIRLLIRKKQFDKALSEVESALTANSDSPKLWNLRGDLIQLVDTTEGPPLKEAANSYERALRLNPQDLEAMEGLAHYCRAVDSRPEIARKYARKVLTEIRAKQREMEQILSEDD